MYYDKATKNNKTHSMKIISTEEKQEIKEVFKNGYKLFKDSYHKTTVYQLIFKFTYIAIIFFLTKAILGLYFSTLNILISQDIKLLNNILTPVLKLQAATTFLIIVTVILAIYYIEKIGLIFIIGYYHLNKNISLINAY